MAALSTAFERACTAQPAALLPPGARLPRQERGVLRRLRSRLRKVFHGVEGASRRHRRAARAGSTIPKNFAELTPEQRAALERLDLDELRELFEQRSRSRRSATTAATAGSAPAARSPFGHGGKNPTGHARRRRAAAAAAMEVAERAPVPRLPQRRRARRAPDRRRAARACASSAARARPRSSTSTRRSTRPARTPASSRSCSGRRAATRAASLLLMDVGGSMDPYAELVSRLFTALARRARLREVPQLLLPQLRLRRGLRGRAAARQGGADRRTCSRTARRARKLVIVGDAVMHPAELLEPGGSIRASPRRRPASRGCSGSRTTSSAASGSTPTAASGTAFGPRASSGEAVPDAPSQRRRHRRRRLDVGGCALLAHPIVLREGARRALRSASGRRGGGGPPRLPRVFG